MKLEVGEFYLSANGNITKIDFCIKAVNSIGNYPFKSNVDEWYDINGRYGENNSKKDLIAHIPKALHFRLCEIIEDYYIDGDVKEFIDEHYKIHKVNK